MLHSHFNLLQDWTCAVKKRLPFVYSPIMALSERLISSLEKCFYTSQADAVRKKRKMRRSPGGHVYPTEAGVTCSKGQQSACNYSVTSANGSEESIQILFTLYAHSVRCCEVRVKFRFDRE